ncbi:hypothetical protein [Pseudomonas chlororaphis]|uniref:hypothetical protein n=1 Tax=Pseudomonas chlororaphis TaxID=587753 RepID=UPI000BE2E230|nr:hypothetical protein [Pseudomonas chlororaphis]
MSNNEMVSVRRDLLVNMVHNQGKRVSAYMPDIAALLAAPANRCGNCGASTVDACNDRGCHFFESGNGEPVPPAGGEPEVFGFYEVGVDGNSGFLVTDKALKKQMKESRQHHFIELVDRAHVTRLQNMVGLWKGRTTNLSIEIADLRAELDALKAQPQGEPVAYRVIFNDGERSKWEDGTPQSQDLYDVRDGVVSGVECAYASPPAPVTVVLPERLKMHTRGLMDAPTVNHHIGWNACLDEVARLNSL